MLNNVVLVGRIVRQPELYTTGDEKAVTNITLAVTRPFKSSITGEYETDFINVTLWENIAQNVVNHCGKGSIIAVRARLVQRVYEVPNYKTIRAVEVVAQRISFIQTKPVEAVASSKENDSDKDFFIPENL